MSAAREFAAHIVRTLRDRGHRAYFAGGCVRDFLLARPPADYDVATGILRVEVIAPGACILTTTVYKYTAAHGHA